jgi:hypothetical protein
VLTTKPSADIADRATGCLLRAARHLAWSILCVVAAGATAIAADTPVTRFDGTYIGMPTADRQNRSPPCAKPETAVLDVKNGAARLRSSLDRRKGEVQPDGSLAMKGVIAVASQHIPGFVEGQFTADRFEGTSRFPNVNCAYHWSLAKSP